MFGFMEFVWCMMICSFFLIREIFFWGGRRGWDEGRISRRAKPLDPLRDEAGPPV
jgi:hypothetical protein